ncbi:DUF6278 family protein [Actinopolymorpha pittospori]
MARGLAVYGPSTEDPEQLAGHLAQCRQLRDLAATIGVDLDGSEQSLARLDRLIGQSHGNVISAWLGNEAGTYLGSVLVNTLPGAMWQVWPNGHPVVRLSSGREIDTVMIAHDRVHKGSPPLPDAYRDAAQDP